MSPNFTTGRNRRIDPNDHNHQPSGGPKLGFYVIT